MVTRQSLVKLRSRALRAKTWFRTLTKVERAILNLTIECVENVRSITLAATISTIIRKISQSLGQAFMNKAEEVGQEIAEKLCSIGARWGNEACTAWKTNKCFVRFIGVSTVNLQA